MTSRDPGAYVVRSKSRTPDGRTHFQLVDMHGDLHRVTVPYNLDVTEELDQVLRHTVITNRAHWAKRPPT